jgi:hypothetical protein
MYFCLNCGSSNVVPVEGEYSTGVGSETWYETGWRCVECKAFEDTVDWLDEESASTASSEAA